MKNCGWLIVVTVLLGLASSRLIAGDASKESTAWKQAWPKKAPASIAAENPKAKAERTWAKAVAADFLEAAIDGPLESARTLLTPDLAQEIKGQGYNLFDLNHYSHPTITSDAFAPDGHEVIIAGTLKHRRDDSPDGEFKVRLVKESGVWKIRFVVVRDKATSPSSPPDAPAVLYKGKPANYWVNQLKDKTPSFHIEALEALGAIAEDDKTVIPVLGTFLADKDKQVATKALESLAGTGKEGLPELVKALDVEHLRNSAIIAIKQMGPDAEGAVPALIRCLDDPNIRSNAAEALGAIGEAATQAIPALEEIFRKDRGLTGWTAEQAAMRIAYPDRQFINEYATILDALVGRKVVLLGFARDINGSATVQVGQTVICVDGLESWPDNIRDKEIHVTGTLVEIIDPDAVTDGHDAVPQDRSSRNSVGKTPRHAYPDAHFHPLEGLPCAIATCMPRYSVIVHPLKSAPAEIRYLPSRYCAFERPAASPGLVLAIPFSCWHLESTPLGLAPPHRRSPSRNHWPSVAPWSPHAVYLMRSRALPSAWGVGSAVAALRNSKAR